MTSGLRTRVMAALGLLAVSAFGCVVPQGSDFSSSHVTDIQLGTTTEAQLQEWFGKPADKTVKSTSGFESTIHNYRYFLTSRDMMGVPTESKSRTLSVEIKDGVVHSYSFQSSMEQDDTKFDVDARLEFKIGATTRKDVEARLGRPSTASRWPTNGMNPNFSAKAPDSTRLVWGYERLFRKMEKGVWINHNSTLVLFFDASDVLAHSEFRKSP